MFFSERIGMGRFQLWILTAAGLSFASDAMMVMQLSFLSEVLREEWNLTDDETALITSILFFGAIFGTLFLGPLADSLGRKPVFLAAASIISLFGMAVAFSTNLWSLLGLLFFVGFGVGGITVPFDILSEVLPSASRGTNLLIIEYFWTLGVLLVVAFAHATLQGTDNTNWRRFMILCSLPCFTSIFLGYFFVPESPRWLCTQTGRSQEALHIVRKAASQNGLDADFLFPHSALLLEEQEEESSGFRELFSPRWRRITLLLWGAWGAFAFGYYGTIMVVTEIFDNEDNTNGDNAGYSFDYGAIFLSSSAELIGTTGAIFFIDRVGRIPLQVVSYAAAGISVTGLCLLASQDHASRGTLIAFSFLARIFEMMASCVTWVSTAEILTTEVRTTGHSAANAVARIGALVAPFLMETNRGSLVKKGMVMLVIHSLTVVFVSQLPETKGSHMGRISATTDEEDDNVDHDLALVEENDDEGNDGDDEHLLT